jgi:hypothetical protein
MCALSVEIILIHTSDNSSDRGCMYAVHIYFFSVVPFLIDIRVEKIHMFLHGSTALFPHLFSMVL